MPGQRGAASDGGRRTSGEMHRRGLLRDGEKCGRVVTGGQLARRHQPGRLGRQRRLGQEFANYAVMRRTHFIRRTSARVIVSPVVI